VVFPLSANGGGTIILRPGSYVKMIGYCRLCGPLRAKAGEGT
jgi:hypothetical protein